VLRFVAKLEVTEATTSAEKAENTSPKLQSAVIPNLLRSTFLRVQGFSASFDSVSTAVLLCFLLLLHSVATARYRGFRV
jgi:hypothetical protein